MHWLHSRTILWNNRVDASSSLYHISSDSTHQPLICICIYINLNIHQIPKLSVLQNKNSFHDNNRLGFYCYGLFRTVMIYIVISRHLYGIAFKELTDILCHSLWFKGIRMIIIKLASLFKRHIIMCFVIIIMADHCNIISKIILYPIDDCSFAGSGTSCNTKYTDFSIISFVFKHYRISPYKRTTL